MCLGSSWSQTWTCSGGSCTTTGSVGIGTSTPGTTLDVAGNIRLANGSYLQGYSTSGSTAYNLLRVDSGDNLTLGAGIPYLTSLYSYGAETVRLSGNVFQINPSGGAASYYFQGGGINTASFGVANTTTDKLLIQGNSSVAGQSALKLQNSSGSVIFNAQNNGNVGVGTSSPGYKLDVQGGQINASGGLCIAGSCQTSWPGSSVLTYSGNNVGIGTTTPQTPLDVVGNVNSAQVGRFESTAGSNDAIVTIQNDTNLTGVHNLDFRGSANTWAWFRNEGLNWEAATNVGLHLFGNPLNTNTPAVLMGTSSAQNTTSGDVQMVSMSGGYAPASGTGTWEALSLTPTINQTGNANGNTYGLFINPALTSAPNWTSLEVANGKSVFLGSVGIGTSSPCLNSAPSNCQLSVNGAIQAKEVVVTSGWSDYVFAPNYELQPLTQTAAYIEQNHHLPDIPSAAEVAEKGVSLGDMQAKLLAKIEELTLHMIEE